MKTLLRSAFLTLAIMALAVPAYAGPLEDGWAAYQRGDYATALENWIPLAEQGDATAQYILGVSYDSGQGVPQDYAEAVKWYRLAADQDIAGAQYNLGASYDSGQGVPRDIVQAYMWFNIGAAVGDEEARQGQDRTAERMTPDQIAEAQRRAREWMVKQQQ